jgi:outer membrane receptor protein involved in Fe transport
MRLKQFTLYTLFFLYNALAGAQETDRLKGYIYDEDGNPLSDVYISIENINLHTNSAHNGYFEFPRIPHSIFTLHFNHISYHPQKMTIGKNLKKNLLSLDSVILHNKTHISETTLIIGDRIRDDFDNLGLPTNTITRKNIIIKNSKTSAELLREEKGIFIQKTSHGGGSAILRGLSSNRILLLVDDIRLNNSTYRLGNHQYLTTVDNNMLERIDIVRGPASVLYGSDALGGAINLRTTDPYYSNKQPFFQINGFGRFASADHEQTYYSSLLYASKHIFFTGSAGYKKYGDLRRGANSQYSQLERSTNGLYQSPSGFASFDIASKIGIKLSAQQQLILSLQHSSQNETPRYDKYENDHFYKWLYAPQKRQLFYLRYEFSDLFPALKALKFTASRQKQIEGRIQQKQISSNLSKEQDEILTNAILLSGKMIYGNHRIKTGAELYFDEIKSGKKLYSADEVLIKSDRQSRYPDGATYINSGFFIDDLYAFNKNTVVEFGGRLSYQKANFTPALPGGVKRLPKNYQPTFFSLTGKLGFKRRFSEKFEFNSFLRQGFRAPNMSDFAKFGQSKGSTFEVPNPNLKAEKITNIDLGIVYRSPEGSVNFNLFYGLLTDLIESAPSLYFGQSYLKIDSVNYKIKSKQNIGNGFISGLEFSTHYQLSETLHLKANAAYTYGQNIKQRSPIGGIPPLFGTVSVNKNLQNIKTEFYIRFAARQSRLSQDDMDDPRIPTGGTPEWFTLNLRGKYKLNRFLSVQAAIENILDLNYREHGSGINGPGRNFMMSLHLQN